MFQKKDYLEYFNQLARVEKEMEKRGKRILAMLKNTEAKKMIRTLIQDEQNHEKIVEEIKRIFIGKNGKANRKKGS